MKTVDEWKALLRARLRLALGAKDQPAVTILRVTLAAIDNAEAPPVTSAPTHAGGAFAGSVGGLGASEVERLALTPAAVLAIVERELGDLRHAAAEYARLGRNAAAAGLSAQADALATVVAAAEAS